MNINTLPQLPKETHPIVIIGAGGIVKDAHLPAYKKAGFTVFGILNRTRKRAQDLADAFEIPHVFDSVADAVAQAPENAVYDVTVMPSGFVEVLEQLPEGAAVLIQKPMGDDYEQMLGILEVCRRRRLKAAINCQLRFAPFVIAARDLIDRGLIGEVYDMEVRVAVKTPWDLFPNVRNHPRLEIQQHSVHYIDLVRSFLGDPSGIWARTCGRSDNDLSSTRSNIVFDYGDNLSASISTNHDHDFGSTHQESFIKWEGSKGCIKAEFGLLKNYPVGEEDRFQYCLDRKSGDSEWHTLEIEGSWFPDAFVGAMATVLRFAEGMDSAMVTDVEDVSKSMACVEAAYASSAKGATAILPIPQAK